MTQRIVPMVAYEDTAAAIDWLVEAFGFTEHGERYVMEDGTIGHAELELGGEIVMLATPNREYESPRTHARHARQPLGGSTTRTSSTGFTWRWTTSMLITHGLLPPVRPILRAPEEPGIGFRIYTAEDLEGHRWMFAQRL